MIHSPSLTACGSVFWSGLIAARCNRANRPLSGLPQRPTRRDCPAARGRCKRRLVLTSSSWEGCLRCVDWQDSTCGAKKIGKRRCDSAYKLPKAITLTLAAVRTRQQEGLARSSQSCALFHSCQYNRYRRSNTSWYGF